MHHFDYTDGELFAENVPLAEIAASVGTPVYVYSSATFERHYTVFCEAVKPHQDHVFYAVKANSNLGVLMTLARLGAGADTVSEGEIRKALAAGIPASKIVFSGVGKTAQELAFAVDAGIYQINVESEGELEALSRIAEAKGKRQAIVLRVNPEIGAGGHAKITTGDAANKFGVSFSEAERLYAKAANMPGVSVKGLAAHIGSQVTEFSAYRAAFMKMRGVVENLKKQGAQIPGVVRGKPTQDYLTRVQRRITLPGAFFLGFVAVLPYIFSAFLPAGSSANLLLSSSGLLIVVGTVRETVQLIETELRMRGYDDTLINA